MIDCFVALRVPRNDGSGPAKDYRTLVTALGVVGGAELSDVPRHLEAGDQFGIAGLSAQGRQSGAVALFGYGESRPGLRYFASDSLFTFDAIVEGQIWTAPFCRICCL